jgi:hypothetical protein
MSHDLILLVVGFVLTTVLGGALGSFFQRRAWNQQHYLQKREEEKTQALKTFEEISRLFDKRIHRMRLMNAALAGLRRDRDDESIESLDDARREYKAVLTEWNDNLNRVLALIEVSFGRAMRQAVEELYAQYAALGRALDLALRLELREDADPVALKSIDFSRRLKRLSDGVYQTNVRMLALLRDDEQRVAGPEPGVQGAGSTITARPNLALGDQGPAVVRLQTSLRERGYPIDVDGSFGLDTYRAVRRLQTDQDLTADALVGPQVWERLEVSE